MIIGDIVQSLYFDFNVNIVVLGHLIHFDISHNIDGFAVTEPVSDYSLSSIKRQYSEKLRFEIMFVIFTNSNKNQTYLLQAKRSPLAFGPFSS